MSSPLLLAEACAFKIYDSARCGVVAACEIAYEWLNAPKDAPPDTPPVEAENRANLAANAVFDAVPPDLIETGARL